MAFMAIVMVMRVYTEVFTLTEKAVFLFKMSMLVVFQHFLSASHIGRILKLLKYHECANNGIVVGAESCSKLDLQLSTYSFHVKLPKSNLLGMMVFYLKRFAYL